jgi:hypothetical protein
LNDFSESSPDLGFVGGKWLTDEKTWAAVSPEVKECIYQALLGDREELDLFKNTISDKFAKDSLNPEEHAILLSFLVCSHDKALRENWSKAAVDRYLSLDQPSVEELERVVQYLPWGRESVSPEAIQAIAKGLVRWNDTIEAPEEKSIQQFARMLERCPVWKERFESELFSKEEGINVPVAEVLLHLYERNGRLRQFFLNLKQEMVKSDSDNSDLQARFFRVLGYAMKLGYPKKPYVSIGYYEQAFSVAEANTQKLACLCDLITAYIDSGQDTKALQLMQSIENQWREKDQESITEIRKTILVKNDSL